MEFATLSCLISKSHNKHTTGPTFFSHNYSTMDGNAPQSFASPISSPSQYTFTFDPPNSIVVCLIITLLIIFTLYLFYISCVIIWHPDREEGQVIHQPDIVSNPSHQSAFSQAIMQHNIWVLGILERSFSLDIEEKRVQRLRASEILPPLVNYGSHDIKSSVSDCAICLEDFVVGESCQVLPVCNHIFHSNCINYWLKKKLTCPICRNCIIDV